MTPGVLGRIRHLADAESLRPDLSRAVRGTVALSVPLVLGLTGHLPVQTAYAVLVAMNIATVDVRGAYSLRLALLAAMTVVLVACAGLGGLVSDSTLMAVLAMGLVALCAGLWRHLSSDYGPSLAISTTLIFALGLAARGDPLAGRHHAAAALCGGLWGLSLQVALWPVRPQHPLRRTVSDTWLALSNLFSALAVDGAAPDPGREPRIAEAEAAFRAAQERATAVILGARRRPGTMVSHLSELNLQAAELFTLGGAFGGVLDSLMRRPDFAAVAPSFAPVLTAFTNTARTVALAVVSRQPSHLRIVDLRLRRLTNLLSVLRERVSARTGRSDEGARLADIVDQLTRRLPAVEAALRATIARADEREAFSLELFDMDTWKLKPLAAAVDLSLRVDPSLVRYSLRSAALTMLGVVALMELHLRHGYWLPFTMMVVLQPDYGSTRKRAAQRVLGTLAGSVLASGILLLHLGEWAAFAATAATGFIFNYCLKRSYGFAVVFITLFVVLLTETGGSVNLWFAVERLGTTLAGGLLALLAAFLFWPSWERDRFPPILAAALRANRAYLEALTRRIAQGGAPDTASLHAKRVSESANGLVFSSLRRLSGDPKNRQEMIERAAALANGNARLTRALNAVLLHMEPGVPAAPDATLREFAERAGEALGALADASEAGEVRRGELVRMREGLDAVEVGPAPAAGADPGLVRLSWIVAQMGRASTELGAMLVA